MRRHLYLQHSTEQGGHHTIQHLLQETRRNRLKGANLQAYTRADLQATMAKRQR